LRRNPVGRAAEAPEEVNLAALTRLAAASSEIVERDLRATIAAIEAQALRYETVIDMISQGVCFFDGEQRLIQSNRRYAAIYRLRQEDVSPGTTWRQIAKRQVAVGTCPIAADDYLSLYASINSGAESRTWTADLKDGRAIHICHQPMSGGGWVATHEDITGSRRAMERQGSLMPNDDTPLLQAILLYFPGGITLMDRDLRIVYANQLAWDILGIPPHMQAIGVTTTEDVVRYFAQQGHYGPGHVETLVAHRMLTVGSRQVQLFELSLKSGKIIEIRSVPLKDGGFLRTYLDITDRRREEEKIAKQARHDSLTELSNRATFQERLRRDLDNRSPERVPVVLYIDLDRFKAVNDRLGHPVGDALLQEVANRLLGCVRSTDMVARVGGDEFAVVMISAQPEREAQALAQQIIGSVSAPYNIKTHHIIIGASIGIAVGVADGVGAEELIKNADLALYQSKSAERGVYRFFQADFVDVNRRAASTPIGALNN